MKPLKLEDIRPQPATFELAKTGRTYELRPIGLDDEKWIRETFGAGVKQVLEGSDLNGLGRIVWRLMREEDRKQFPTSEIDETGEDGVTRKIQVGGVKLLISCIVGIHEKLALHQALLQTIGISKPILDELMEEELKKNLAQASLIPSAGEASSTSSPQSTDGPSITSGSSLPGKSPSPSEKSTPGRATSSLSRRPSTASKSRSKRKVHR